MNPKRDYNIERAFTRVWSFPTANLIFLSPSHVNPKRPFYPFHLFHFFPPLLYLINFLSLLTLLYSCSSDPLHLSYFFSLCNFSLSSWKKKKEKEKMSNKSPIFPMPEPQHFSDYGFDPQIDYFQVLEEARRHKKETARAIDGVHFRLQKPISKDESMRPNKAHKKKRWWRNALLFFKFKWVHPANRHHRRRQGDHDLDIDRDVHRARARALRASLSGPVYITESRSGSSTPSRSTSRPSSGPLAGTLTPMGKAEAGIPYLSLRELNMEQEQQRMSTSSLPIYLVT